MTAPLPSLPEWHGVTRAQFEAEIVPRNAPAILRGVAAAWPAVARARQSPLAIAQYLAEMDNGTPVDALMLAPEEEGRIFYDASMEGFNYLRTKQPLSRVLEQALRYAQFPRAPAVAVQSALVAVCIPEFKTDNVLALLDAGIEPRIWMGTAIITPAHFDEQHNIAVCVAGRRRFTLFAPEQVANLYVGPLDHTPAGMPMSLVDFAKPDFDRFPRFREAWAAARVAELAPGDAIYMPPLWWHHVHSLERFNVLMNWWWLAPAAGHAAMPHGLDALMHAAATMRSLPPAQRAAWRHLFEHYAFDVERDVTGHIPPERQGMLGPMNAEQHAQLRALLAQRFSR
ncbi:MAG: cupin-like domain-containing protein [Burkholderiaceae bacterium]|jgi:hypothetical protein